MRPLHRACCKRQLGVVRWLVRDGADVNATEHENGWAPIHSAVKAWCDELEERDEAPPNDDEPQCDWPSLVRCLCEHGADVNLQDSGGDTPA